MRQPCFWCLSGPASLAKLAKWADEMDYETTIVCPLRDGHQRAGRRMPNLSIILPGRATEDFVWTWQSECLLTDRTLDLLRSNGFAGFEVIPAKARFARADQPPPRLWELVVTGSAGVAPPESGIRFLEHCSGCNHSDYSACTHPEHLVDPSQWDGSDFFTVWPLGRYIFVTERVAARVRAEPLTGCVLERPADLDFSAVRTGRIGVDLSLYPMPEQGPRSPPDPREPADLV